jgi:hypothetical protein
MEPWISVVGLRMHRASLRWNHALWSSWIVIEDSKHFVAQGVGPQDSRASGSESFGFVTCRAEDTSWRRRR